MLMPPLALSDAMLEPAAIDYAMLSPLIFAMLRCLRRAACCHQRCHEADDEMLIFRAAAFEMLDSAITRCHAASCRKPCYHATAYRTVRVITLLRYIYAIERRCH